MDAFWNLRGDEMTGMSKPYLLYMAAVTILVAAMLITPYLAFQKNPLADVLYDNVF